MNLKMRDVFIHIILIKEKKIYSSYKNDEIIRYYCLDCIKKYNNMNLSFNLLLIYRRVED